MKKIYTGILAIVAVLAIVGGSAYAIFSNKVTVSGVVLGTQASNLEIAPINTDEAYGSNLNVSDLGLSFDFLSPGDKDNGDFWLKNNSPESPTSDVWVPLMLDIKGSLNTYSGDWADLAHALEIQIFVRGDEAATTTGWKSLYLWKTQGFELKGDPIAPGDAVNYTIEVRLPETYHFGPKAGQPVGNEVAGKKLWGIQFDILGTQAN